MKYKEQLSIVSAFMIPPDTTMRMDCPFCHNKNTLSITNDDYLLSWYCFHASCKAKGTEKKGVSMKSIKKIFDPQPIIESDIFNVPDSFKQVYTNQKAVNWAKAYNCWESWSWGRVGLRYDVKQNRLVFLIKDFESDEIRGAVGRSLDRDTQPKWYMYGNKKYPFYCGKMEDAILVEDCASACAVSNIATGIAMMGTSYNDEWNKYLKKFKKIFICLDRDATTKAFDISNKIRYVGNVEVIVKILDEDLKNFETDKIRSIIYDK